MEERLQKIMARAGVGSRRACEELITKGRVTVNGKLALIGMKADPDRDRILVDGRPLDLQTPNVYIALNKPRHVLSTLEADDPRPTVRDLVPVSERIYPVGRLDAESEGLILLTNDGELANRLTHPRYGHEKEYRVLVARRPDDEQIATWRRGVVLSDGYKTSPASVFFESTFGKGAWLRVILTEGRKRQIRETASILGLPVVRIIRVRIGSLHLGNMKPRQWRYLREDEVAALKGSKEVQRQQGKSKTRPKKTSSSSQKDSRPGNSGASNKPRHSSKKGKK